MTDDLADFLSDWQSGAPNTIICKARTDDSGSGASLTDARLYRLIEAAASQVVSTLRAASLLWPARRPATAHLTAIEGAARFATLTIAHWVGWREELSQPSAFSPRRPRPARALLAPCTNAVTMLLDQQRTGYREAIHWMTVPRFDEDHIRLEMHPALLFQRAIVLDGLLDALAAGLDIPATVLAQEALLLLKAKRDDVRGGWSYLPGVPELPPDVDDLAMVLQVLWRCGGQGLAAACHQALDLVLATAERGDAITTWILEPGEAGQQNERFRQYIELTHAGGAHPEVVANLLYAASMPATERNKQAIANTMAYLEAAQDNDGSWHSRWYWGRHYGTYRAILALTRLAPHSPALNRARNYLMSGQNADHGWGANGRSDPLSTAFAALALATLARPGTGRYIRSGLEYLLTTQQADGSWPACPFIAFPRVGGPGVHIYRSSTITTTFCLKAILASQPAQFTRHVAAPWANATTMPYRPALAHPAVADWS